MATCTAIEITSPEVAQFITAICPAFMPFDYEEDLKGNFFMIGFPVPGEFAVILAASINDHWDHIEPGPRVKFVTIVR